jgi:Na+/H+ antiporter NhaC
MIPAIVVLVLAWAMACVCGPGYLDTAGYIISLVQNIVRVEFLPAIAFVVSAAIAVSIGSSFTTMALLLPMFIPLSVSLLQKSSVVPVDANAPVFLATIGAVLSGAIFGDHCSPISDTTILSSAAAGCDHLEHVATQLPYAMLIAACSLLFGYIPAGFGVPWWIALTGSSISCCGIILIFGKQTSGHQ